MARTALTPIAAKGPFPGTVNATDLNFAFTASDVANGNDFAASGNDVLIVQNTDAGAQTFTLNSVADGLKRTGDVTTYSLGAGLFALFYFGRGHAWQQSTGRINVNGQHANIKFAVVALGAG